jgi:thiamine biosynthesis lipoprotein
MTALRFAHQAMHTEFEIFCDHPDRDYAQQACWATFDLLDRIEAELSRFIENSDIARINSLAAGESTRVCRWTMECLQIARRAHTDTSGAIDISLGTGFEKLELSQHTVRTPIDGIRLDLGGIGKGYAVDRMAEVLREWDVHRALLHGGHSSVLAMDPPDGVDGWPLTINDELVHVHHQAISASGIRKRDHIVDPRTGQPVRERAPVWVTLDAEGEPSPCAVTEAYSTAFLILPDNRRDPKGAVIPLRKTPCVQDSPSN